MRILIKFPLESGRLLRLWIAVLILISVTMVSKQSHAEICQETLRQMSEEARARNIDSAKRETQEIVDAAIAKAAQAGSNSLYISSDSGISSPGKLFLDRALLRDANRRIASHQPSLEDVISYLGTTSYRFQIDVRSTTWRFGFWRTPHTFKEKVGVWISW